MELENQIARDLLKIQAVFFRPNEPFTWASGIKSPVYCDNRLTLTDVAVRTDVENGLAELIRTHYPDAEVLMALPPPALLTQPLPDIFWACPWAMSAAAQRTTAGRIRLKAACSPVRRWLWWRI